MLRSSRGDDTLSDFLRQATLRRGFALARMKRWARGPVRRAKEEVEQRPKEMWKGHWCLNSDEG